MYYPHLILTFSQVSFLMRALRCRGSVRLRGHMHKWFVVELGPEPRCNGALKIAS